MTFSLTVPEATPSLNEFFHAHWKVQFNAKKKWAVLLLFAIKSSGRHESMKAHGKRRLVIQRFGKRALDADNGLGGCKVVIDALRMHELLVDDDESKLAVTFENHKLPKGEEPHTVLVFEDL